ncbi:uncharacterized protein [Nicotiana tomentosiformis]|uniref:uncharacterized protein n=1 Tax=Nicotiana tomentosiformis TaxID=4098 RepID=UPI00388CE2E0
MGLGVCYACGYSGHVIRDCPMIGDASIAQPTGSVAGSSSSVRPPGQGSQAPMGRGRGRGRVSSSSGPQNRIYALAGWQDQELSPDVVTDFLGHIISGEGIRVDTQKIEAVKTWPRPTTPIEVRIFLGLALKDRLTSAPVLTFLEGTDGYVIYCDASGIGLGYVLMQHGDIGITIQDTTTSSLVTEVKERQYEDPVLAHYKDTTPQKEKTPFEITENKVLRYRGRLCVPNVAGLCRQVTEQLSYKETPIAILDRQVRRLTTKDVASVKVLWRNNNVKKMTWEAEEDMKSRYPHLSPLPEKDPTETSQP